MRNLEVLIISCILLLLPAIGLAANFYVDPVKGSYGGDGSPAQPWKSLQRLFDDDLIESREWNSLPYTSGSSLVPKNPGAPITAGDTIILRSGNYGELFIRSYYNAVPITIVAEQGNVPLFRNIVVRSFRNWNLAGLTVNASAFQADGFSTLISLESHNWTGPIDNVTVSNCNLFSIADSSGWSRTDWNSKTKNGIGVSGKNMKIAHNSLRNVNFGISVGASHSVVEHNSIENFAGDGLRGLGDYTTFEYNTVKNCYDVNDNHDDGFQSWSVGGDGKVGTGVVRGIVLRGNTIINYEDPNQPFRGTLQGIGCFDGMFADWIVERNTVRVDHWHGISLYGAINTVIRDNVVTDPNGDANIGPPWIMLRAHKNNTPSRDCLVACNVSPKLIVSDQPTITNYYNTLSETGGPRHSKCPALITIAPVILPILLERNN